MLGGMKWPSGLLAVTQCSRLTNGAAAATIATLETEAAVLVGSRSPLVRWRSALGALDQAERPAAGRRLNEARTALEDALAERRALL